MLDFSPALTQAKTARQEGTSRARVPQFMNLLKLSDGTPQALLDADPPAPSERSLRPVVAATSEKERKRLLAKLGLRLG